MGYKLTWRQGIGYMYQPGSQCMGTEHLAEPTLITWLLDLSPIRVKTNVFLGGADYSVMRALRWLDL